MMKYLLLFIVLSLPFCLSAQYRLKKRQIGEAKAEVPINYSLYKKHHAGEIIADAGFATLSQGLGILYYLRGEYFIDSNLSGRLNFFINSLRSKPEGGSYLQVSADVAYHFYQEKRFDVYCYLGLGFHKGRYQSNLGGNVNSIIPTINSGVGGRYRITPSFGLQLELGRTSSFGVYKSLDFLKDS